MRQTPRGGPAPTADAVREAVACPYCEAEVGEHCRTMNGTLTGRYPGSRVNHNLREIAARRKLTGA